MTVIDDFEDGGMTEYAGDTGGFTVKQDSTVAYEGSYYLYNNATGNAAITDTNDLPSLQQGDSFHAYLNGDSNAGIGEFLFGVQAEEGSSGMDCYAVGIGFSNSELRIELCEAGSFTVLKTVAASETLSLDTWYEVLIEWKSDGTIDATLKDTSGNTLATGAVTDTTYTSGGIGWYGSGSLNATYYRYDLAETVSLGQSYSQALVERTAIGRI